MNKKMLLSVGAITFMLFCAKRDEQIGRINPFDPQGENWHPPTVVAMADTTVFIKDSVYLHASAIDSNGMVNKYLWAKDGKNFRDTTDSTFLIRFSSHGKDTILVLAIDTDGVKSKDTGKIIVTVRLGRPTILVPQDGAVVGIGDSVKLIASCFDTNGFIKAIFWAMDGTNYSATPGTDTVVAVFSSQGTKTILAKVMDDDSLVAYDTVRVFVRGKAPLIFSPVPNATLGNNITTLQWHPGIYNSHFQVLVDTINPPSAIVNTSTPDTFSVVSNLVFNKTYLWKVIGFSNAGDTASSEIWKFTTPVKPPIPTDGLVAYYPFNGNANDASGNGNNGTVNGATLTSDRFGNANSAYLFNGSSGIQISSVAILNTNSPKSIFAWVNIPLNIKGDDAASIRTVIDCSPYGHWRYLDIFIDSSGYHAQARRDPNAGNDALSQSAIGPNQWHLIGFTWIPGGKILLYVDGLFSSQSANAQSQWDTASGGITYIGIEKYFNAHGFIGSIDDIRIYNRALTTQEIQALYQEGGYVPPLNKPLLSAGGIDSTKIQTQWNSQSGATGYILQSASDSIGPFSQLYSGSDTTYFHTGLTNNQKVWYRVKATNATQSSDWSDTLMAAASSDIIALMPSSKIIIQGKLPDSTQILFNALSMDSSLHVTKAGNYLMWKKSLSEYSSSGVPSSFSVPPLPSTVTISFAISKNKDFLIGAQGTFPDLLLCIGAFYSSQYYSTFFNVQYSNNWESFWPNARFTLSPNDIALAGITFREFKKIADAGYLTGFPTLDDNFKNASSIQIQQKCDKKITWLGYTIYISNGNENYTEGWESNGNRLWCNFTDPANTGTATRNLFLQYFNATNACIFSCDFNNNSNETWTYLNDSLFNHQRNWGQSVAVRFDSYPQKISIIGTKTWSHINPSVSVAVLGDSVAVLDHSETPSAGHRINPLPEILVFEPNKWYP